MIVLMAMVMTACSTSTPTVDESANTPAEEEVMPGDDVGDEMFEDDTMEGDMMDDEVIMDDETSVDGDAMEGDDQMEETDMDANL